MAYSEEIAERVRKALGDVADVREISMFGGRCFMVNGKMFVCAGNHELLCRIGRKNHEEAFAKEGTRPMVNNGRIMRGFLFVDEQTIETEDAFNYWIELCRKYNRTFE